VCVCVCLSHSSIVSKQLNVGLHKQHHVIAQGLWFSEAKSLWWTTPLPPEICAQNDQSPFRTPKF